MENIRAPVGGCGWNKCLSGCRCPAIGGIGGLRERQSEEGARKGERGREGLGGREGGREGIGGREGLRERQSEQGSGWEEGRNEASDGKREEGMDFVSAHF